MNTINVDAIFLSQPKMTAKQKRIIKNLIGTSVERFLQCLSSEYCEVDEKEFKLNRGASFKEAREAVGIFIRTFN